MGKGTLKGAGPQTKKEGSDGEGGPFEIWRPNGKPSFRGARGKIPDELYLILFFVFQNVNCTSGVVRIDQR